MKQKKDVDYFDMFTNAAQICERAGNALSKMLHSKPEDFLTAAKTIHDIEREGDTLYHSMMAQLNRSFITPIDREDIMSIFIDIEQTIDAIDDVALLMDMLQVSRIRPEAKEMVSLIVNSTTTLVEATREFRHFKKSTKLNDFFIKINDIEEQGDVLYQQSVKQLFANEPDVREVLRWKNLFDSMEQVLDAAEHAADKLERVVIKNS